MNEALRIEQRLLDMVSGRQRKHRPQQRRESPREMEQRAVEKLYGGRPTVVVLTEHDADDETA
jgi:hypothetical protein